MARWTVAGLNWFQTEKVSLLRPQSPEEVIWNPQAHGQAQLQATSRQRTDPLLSRCLLCPPAHLLRRRLEAQSLSAWAVSAPSRV